MREVSVRWQTAPLAQIVEVGPHALPSDEPPPAGVDSGPSPHEYLLASLGTCTAMTLQMYARRKEWPLHDVRVTLAGRHEDGRYVIDRRVTMSGDLSEEQRARLLEIAAKCPVHRTLTGAIAIETGEGS